MEVKRHSITLNSIYRQFLRILGTKSAFIFLAVLFRLALELGYLVYVNPRHGYSGFVWNPDAIKYLESWILFTVFVFLVPHRLKKPSDFLMNILFFGLMTSLFSFYGLADQPRQHLYIVILGYVLIAVFRRGRPIRFPVLREGRVLSFILVGAGALGVTAWFIASGGLSFFNLDLTEVYQSRRAAGAVINAGPMGYVNTWAWKVFGPALLAIALWRKKYWLTVMVVGLHILCFGVSAHKSVLFYPFLVFFLWFWLRRTNAISVFPLGLITVVLVSLLSFVVMDYGLPASLFIRRVFYVIANNTFDYYEFFSANPLVWWSNSSVTFGLLDYPYEIGPADLIGQWRGTESHVNNTFLSTGYMHAGVWGIILYGALAGFLFRLIDSFAGRALPVWLCLAVIIVPSRSLLLSADLPTSILTHGIGIAIVILLLLRKSVKFEHNNFDFVKLHK